MNRQRWLQSVGLVLALLVVAGPVVAGPVAARPRAAPEATFGDWVTTTVDSNGNVGLHSSIALDAANYAHISYYDTLNGDLKYAYQDATGWYTATLDSAGDVGQFTSLKVDSQGYAHISYYGVSNGDLKYAYQDAGGWHVETVDPTNQTGRYTSLALDSNDYPHISYEAITGYVVKYAYKDVTGWHYESPPSVGQVFNTAIALNSSDEPRIAYIDGQNHDLYYGYKDGTGWHFSVVYNTASGIGGLGFVVDASDKAYLAYGVANLGTVLFSYQDGMSGWIQETVQSGAGTTNYYSLAQAGGTIHMSWWSAPLGALQYGERTASGWRLTTVVTGSVGQYSGIALDSNGRPHISHWASSSNDLMYTWVDATWYTETVDATVGNYVSLQFDRYSRPRVCFYDAVNQNLIYGQREATGWYTETVDSEWDVGQYCSLALDAAGQPHIAYYYATEGDLRYAYRDAGGWHIENVDAAPSPIAGKWNSITLDAQGYPHISYYHESWQQLRHAYKDGTGWHSEGVDISQAGRYTSIAMNLAGTYPRISYQKISTTDLMYAYKDGTGWHTMTAYADPDDSAAGAYTALRINDQDFPVIAFARGVDLKYVAMYTYYDGMFWHPSLVDAPSIGSVGLWNTLALDATGQAHVVTLDQTAGELRYAQWSGAAWYTLPLTKVGAEGGYSSLTIDSLDHLGVAYYNASGPQQVEYTHNNCLSVAVAPNPPACVNTVVAFDNTSFGVLPIAWNWSFGDGVTSTVAYPTHTYGVAGSYLVTLGGTNSCGMGDVTATQAISSTPTAGYTYTVPICAGQAMQFQNTTVASPTVVYTWTFGDGGVSNAISPTHTYAAPGSYECFLVASNGCGQDTVQHTVIAHGPPAVAPTWSPPLPEVHQAVLFTAQTTSTLPVDYVWDFGDGGSGSGVTTTHAYAVAGDYTVTVTGTTGCGTDVAQAVVTVVCYEAAAADLSWTPEVPTIGVPTTFTASVSGSLPLTCTWDFGDGNTVGPAACGGLLPIAHTYVATGTYIAALTVQNDCGVDIVSGTLTVVALPQAGFTSNSPVCCGESMYFTNTSSGADPLTFLWMFGDGITSTLENPAHTYAQPGDYEVTLLVTNPYGSSQFTGTVTVRDPVHDLALNITPPQPAPGEVVTFTAQASGTTPLSYTWDFGDGAGGSGPLITHTYAVTDSYTVTVAAANVCGEMSTTAVVEVSFCVPPDGLDFTYASPLQRGHVAPFTATVSAGDPPLTFGWDFGDGTGYQYGATTMHSYASAGTFTVTLVSWNDCAGSVRTVSQVVVVEDSVWNVYLPLVAKNYYSGDMFEPDNTPQTATTLVRGSPQQHNFAPPNDVDWVRVSLNAGTAYTLGTSQLASGVDTMIYLYAEGSYDTPLAQNDDCGYPPPDNLASCLTYTPTSSGAYYLKVTNVAAVWGAGATYTLSLTQP